MQPHSIHTAHESLLKDADEQITITVNIYKDQDIVIDNKKFDKKSFINEVPIPAIFSRLIFSKYIPRALQRNSKANHKYEYELHIGPNNTERHIFTLIYDPNNYDTDNFDGTLKEINVNSYLRHENNTDNKTNKIIFNHRCLSRYHHPVAREICFDIQK